MAQGTMAWILENATKRVRYFRHRNGTIAARMEQDSGVFEASPNYTEVQVVPVDAIVIRRDELPEVTVDTEKWTATANGAEDPYTARLDANPGWAWHYGVNAIAVFEYLREHPPVDEGMVQAVADLISEAVDSGISVNATDGSLERFLVERGVRVEAKS